MRAAAGLQDLGDRQLDDRHAAPAQLFVDLLVARERQHAVIADGLQIAAVQENRFLGHVDELDVHLAQALAELATMEIPAEIKKELAAAYPEDAKRGLFDTPAGIRLEMVIPKPFDPRVVPHVARKVAEAAIKSGVARKTITDFDAYEKSVAERIRASRGN